MDYKRAYNEALERATSFQEKYGGDYAGYIFPELAESEEEKTAREIKDFILYKAGHLLDEATEHRFIKFLEKQKEQKSTELPKSEDYGIDGLYAAIDILQKTLGKVDGYQTDDGILEHKCAISAVKELYEQKPAEWSEEDEKNLKLVTDCVYEFYPDPVMKYWLRDWLRTLRSRPKSSDNWKPSEEQMEIVCPELAESDDERIREGLSKFLWGVANGEVKSMPSASQCQEWLSYLEKQNAEPFSCGHENGSSEKPNNQWSEDFDTLFDEYCDQHPDGLTLEECGKFFYQKGKDVRQEWSESEAGLVRGGRCAGQAGQGAASR